MAASATAAVPVRKNVMLVDRGDLHPTPLQPRTDFPEDYIQQLAQSIRVNDIITPLLVRASTTPGKFEIIDGECRWRAAAIAGVTQVPIDVQSLSDLEAMNRILASFENRLGLDPLDEGRAFKQRMELGRDDIDAVAQSIGLSTRYVYDSIALVEDLIDDAKALLQRKLLTRSHAILIARLKPEDQARVLDVDANRDLWTEEHTLLTRADEEQLEDEAPRATDPYFGMKFKASVRELERWIAHHVRFDPKHDANLELFPETAVAVAAAEQLPGRGKKVIHGTHDYRAHDDIRKDESGEKVYGAQSWRLADGSSADAPTCEHSVLMLIVAGPGYGTTLRVCVRRDKCETHFGKELRAKKKANGANSRRSSTDDYWAQERERQAKEEERNRRETDAWKQALPALNTAIVAAIAKAPLQKLADVLLHNEDAPARKLFPGKLTAERLLQRLTYGAISRELNGGSWDHARRNATQFCKRFGVDVPKLLAAAAAEDEARLKKGIAAIKAKLERKSKPAKKKGAAKR